MFLNNPWSMGMLPLHPTCPGLEFWLGHRTKVLWMGFTGPTEPRDKNE